MVLPWWWIVPINENSDEDILRNLSTKILSEFLQPKSLEWNRDTIKTSTSGGCTKDIITSCVELIPQQTHSFSYLETKLDFIKSLTSLSLIG